MKPQTTIHPDRGDLDKMTKKPASVQRELEEARRIVSQVIVPPAGSQAPNHRAAVIRELYRIAHEQNMEVSALSWNGFNLMGDRRSIEEVQRLMSCEARMKALEERLNGR
jgi:hypothetical protein